MSENIGIGIQAGLNVAQSTTNIKQQIQKIQELLKPLNIKIDNNTLVKEFDKVSTSIQIATDGTSKIQKNIINIATEEGKLVQITQAYNKEINTMAVSGIKIVDNLKAQANEVNKIAEAEKKRRQEASDTARRMIADEENQRVATTTNAQRRIEQAILRSNETIAQQQVRMNSSQANGYRYEQMFLQASRERGALDARNAELESQRLIASARNLQAERQQTAELQRQVVLYQEQNAIQLRNLQSQYGSLARTPEIQSQISTIRSTVGGLSSSVLDANGFRTQSAQINTAISGIRASLNEARAASDNFGNDLVKNGIKMLQWGVIGGILFGTLRQIKEGFSFINDLDKAMTNISMITGKSRDSIVKMTKAYADLATQLHTTTGEAMKSAEEFLRAGHNQEETLKLIQSATVMGAIAGQDSKSSADQLIAITNGFKMSADQAIDVVDKLTTVDNMSATSTKELGTALERTSVSAQMAGTSFSELVSYIGTVSSISRKSASSIGESFKTIFSRFQDVRGGKNFDAENQDISNVERDFKKYADISIRETSGEFKDFSIVINELSSKWNTLSEVAQSAASKALAGTRQRENFLILMNNMDTALKLQSAQLDSSGSSMTRYGEFAKSTEAKLNDLTNAVQKIWLNLLSSEAINSAIEVMTKFVGVIDSVTSTYGGLTTAIYLTIAALAIFKSQAIAGVVTSISQWVISFGLAETASLGLSMGIKSLSTAMLGLITNPIFLAIAAIGALTYAFVSYANHQKKVKEQLEATGSAQKDFTKSVEDFQNTLDPKKIDGMATSLEKIKKAVDYDETIKKIQTLKDEIAGLQESEVEQGADWTKTIASKTKDIEELTASIKPYTDAQSKYNEQQKIATALDYESVQAGNKKIALKIRENESNRQLIDSYQKVHDKMVQGNELTKEEANLNQKMIDKYPEYTKVLNDKTTAVGLDIDALKLNQTAEEALAIVSFNAMKTKAESSALATKQIIADTEARIHAIQAEIDALQGKNEAMGSANANIQYQKLLEQGSAQTFMEFKNGTIFNDTITPKLKIDLSGAYKQLQTAKQTLGAWNTLSNMSIDDLRKGVSGSSSSFDPPSSDKDAKDTKEKTQSMEDLTSALLAQINAEHLLTAAKTESLKKELESAKSAKDYQLIQIKNNEILANQTKELNELSIAHDKINKLEDSALYSASPKFGDISRWYQGDDNQKSVTFLEEYNQSSDEVRDQMEKTFTTSQILRNGWMDNKKAVDDLKLSQIELAKTFREDLIKSLEEQSSLLSSSETSTIESSFKNLDIESWIKDNITATSEWADVTASLQEEISKLGTPTTLAGQLKYNELLQQSAKLAADALKAEIAYAKEVEKAKQNALFESTDANLQEIMDKIDAVDQAQQLSKGGISSAVPKIDMEIVPRIDYKSVEEAIAEIPKPNVDEYDFEPPKTFVTFIHDEFTNAVLKAKNDIADLTLKINSLGEVTPANQTEILSYYQKIQDVLTTLSKTASEAEVGLNISLKNGEISQEDFDKRLKAIQVADLEVLAIPKFEMTADAQASLDAVKEKIGSIAVNTDTEEANKKIQDLIKDNEVKITAIFEDTAALQAKAELQIDTSSIHTIYVQTVEGEKPEGFAKGTKSSPSGLAIVSEKGRELIRTPDGTIYLSGDDGAELVNLPEGTQITPNNETEKILKQNNGKIPAYAEGTGSHITDIDFLNDSLDEFAQSISDISKEIKKTTKTVEKDNKDVEKSNQKIEKAKDKISKYINEDGTLKKEYVGNRSVERKVERANESIAKEEIKNKQLVTKAESDQAILDAQNASKKDYTEKLVATQKALANLNSAQYIEQKINLYQEAITVASENIDKLYDSIAKYKNDDGTYDDNEQTRAVLAQIKSNFEAQKSAQLSVKQLVKERFEAEYEGFDKAQTKAEAQVSYLQKVLEFQRLIGASIEEQLATEQAIQNENQNKIKSLQAEKTQLEADKAEAEAQVKADLAKVDPNYTAEDLANALANSQEFNQASDKLSEVNSELIDANIAIKQTAQEIENIKFDNIVKPFKDAITNLQVLLQLLDETDFAGSIANIEAQMAQEAGIIANIKQQIATEMARTDISAGEKAENVADLTTQLNEAELAMKGFINSAKEFQNKQLAKTFKDQYEAIEKTLFNGSTEQEAQDALNQRIALQEKYLSGAEKDLEISKIRAQIQSEGLTLTAEQTALLNTQGDIEKSSIERLQKQLDIQQLQLKVKNLMDQKTIQQMTKNADGTWDFAYVADQEAIATAQEELATSQVDLINWEQDEVNQADQEKLDEKSKYLARIKVIMDNALNGEYDSMEEFTAAMTALNREYMGDMNLINSDEWNNIFTTTQSNLDSITTAYSDYVADMEELAIRAKEAMQNIIDAQISNATVEKDVVQAEKEENQSNYNPGQSNPNVKTSTTTTTTISLDTLANYKKFDTGGATGNSEGLAYLDKKEIVLNPPDTKNLLESIQLNKTILDSLKGFDFSKIPMVNMLSNFKPIDAMKSISGALKQATQTVQYSFNIDKLELPNVNNQNGVESLINGLSSYAIQYSKK